MTYSGLNAVYTKEYLNTTNPIISIGMPVYNAEKYIGEAIESLLGQTFTQLELIISDNASTDRTGDICEYYAKKDSRVRYIKQNKNFGPVKNFEFVLEQSKADYFMWAAHDDRWDSDFIRRAINIHQSDKDCGLVFTHYLIRNLETGHEAKVNVKSLESNYSAINYILSIFYMCPSMIYGVFKTKIIKELVIEFFDFSDLHFVSQIAIKSKVSILNGFFYVAGTKGSRVPYSLTGGKINRKIFLGAQYKMLGEYFRWPMKCVLFSITLFLMMYNKIRLWRY